MAKGKKYHYYVLVYTNKGPVYVTSVNNTTKVAHWDKEEKPLEMCKEIARDLCFGLSANFTSACVVEMLYELDNQPYRYNEFEFEIKKVGE